MRNGGNYAEIHQNYAMGNLLMLLPVPVTPAVLHHDCQCLANLKSESRVIMLVTVMVKYENIIAGWPLALRTEEL